MYKMLRKYNVCFYNNVLRYNITFKKKNVLQIYY